jgi:hypothetical protein
MTNNGIYNFNSLTTPTVASTTGRVKIPFTTATTAVTQKFINPKGMPIKGLMKLAPGEVVWPQVVPLGAVDTRRVGEEAQAVVGEKVEAFLGRPSVNFTNIL